MFAPTWRNKAAAVFALLASPLAIYVGYAEQARISQTMAHGQEYPALIEKVQPHRGRRGNISYDVWLKWTDSYGIAHEDYVSVSDSFGERARAGQSVSVRVAPGEDKPVLTQDAEGKTRECWWIIWAGVAIGNFGVCFSPCAFRRERRA